MGQVLTMVVGAEEERVKVEVLVSTDEHREACAHKLEDKRGHYQVVVNIKTLNTFETQREKWAYLKKVLSKFPLFKLDRLADDHKNYVKVEVKSIYKPPILAPERIDESIDEVISGDYLADIVVHDYENLATFYCLEPIW